MLKTFSFSDLLHRSDAVLRVCAQSSVITIIGAGEYQPSTAVAIRTKIAEQCATQCITLDLEIADVQQSALVLSLPFLGQNNLYWCGNISELPVHQTEKWRKIVFDEYAGPHSILLWTNDASLAPKSGIRIELPERIDADTAQQFAVWCDIISQNKSLIITKTLSTERVQLTLDEALLLASYKHVVGTGENYFVQEWLTRLFPTSASLFTLSAAFFARDKKRFYAAWAPLSDNYSAPFWIAYWSDQLWRAYAYVALMHAGKKMEAQKIAFRLPFSLMQRDWKKLSPQSLLHAHEELCRADHALKNGAQVVPFEPIFEQFFKIF